MSHVGKHYVKDRYNCANFVSEWYRDKLGIEIPVINEFSRSFLVWMRRNFTDITTPENNCLVLMITNEGTYHVGVYESGGVWHNFRPSRGHGAVCKWTLGSIKAHYKRVSFHKWSK